MHLQTSPGRINKAEDTSRTKLLVLEGDKPSVLLGEDHGANAVEAVLHALASCLCVGFVYNAAAQGITISSLDFIDPAQ